MEDDPYRLGPYRITARERVVASLLISFRTGHWVVRLWCAAVALLFGGGALAGLAAGEPLVAGLCFFLLALTFVLLPAVRLQWRTPAKTVSLTGEGLVSDSGVASILLRWPGIRSSHHVGGYLIVMVSRGCAIIVPPSAAPPNRLRGFAEELERRRKAGEGRLSGNVALDHG
ncbi:MAG: hypothetical protein ACJ8DZ_02425 [Allosphingosinicella sp.]